MRLFVYGTLLTGSATPMARWLQARMRGATPARVRGRLFAIRTRAGVYPALLLPGTGATRVTGMVCDVRLTARDLARLDRYEGREYRRTPVWLVPGVSPRNSARSQARAYAWVARLPPGARWIADGDFLAWLAANRAAAYRAGRA